MNEGGANDVRVPRVHTPHCRLGSVVHVKMKGVSCFPAAEGSEGHVTGRCDSRCSQVPWIVVRVISSGLSHPPPVCATVLIHRATLITVQVFYVKSCV